MNHVDEATPPGSSELDLVWGAMQKLEMLLRTEVERAEPHLTTFHCHSNMARYLAKLQG